MITLIREAALMKRLRKIIAEGPYDLREFEGTGGTGGAGRLIEHLLGIQANNVGAPDAVEFEIKTTMDKGSLLTLFHKEPGGRAKESMSDLIKGFGWPPTRGDYPAGTLSFRHTIGNTPTERGFRTTAAEKSVRVTFNPDDVAPAHSAWLRTVHARCGGRLERPPTWTEDELSRVASRKLPNCVYVRGQRRGSMVMFEEMKILRDFLPSKLFEAIRRGAALVDFDARMHPAGGVRNHGTKFRIRKSEFDSLYDDAWEA